MKQVGSITGDTNKYQAENLFPDYSNKQTTNDKFNYVRDLLIEMASNGSLFLTDIYNQGNEEVIETAGMIVMGQEWEMRGRDRFQIKSYSIDPTIAGYRVNIKSLTGKPLRWKIGNRPAGRKRNVEITEDIYMETESNEKQFSLVTKDAWICLRQLGKFCKKATRTGIQENYWKVEEVNPSEQKPKRGRNKIEE